MVCLGQQFSTGADFVLLGTFGHAWRYFELSPLGQLALQKKIDMCIHTCTLIYVIYTHICIHIYKVIYGKYVDYKFY